MLLNKLMFKQLTHDFSVFREDKGSAVYIPKRSKQIKNKRKGIKR